MGGEGDAFERLRQIRDDLYFSGHNFRPYLRASRIFWKNREFLSRALISGHDFWGVS